MVTKEAAIFCAKLLVRRSRELSTINQSINHKLLYSALLTMSQKRFMNSERQSSLANQMPQPMRQDPADLEFERPIGLIHRSLGAGHFTFHCIDYVSRLLRHV